MIFGPTDTASRLRSALPSLTAESAESEAAFVERSGIRVLTRGAGSMPPRLDGVPDAPKALFMLGECDLAAPHAIAIVGTRRATAAGVEFCRRFVSRMAELCPGTLIVSGLAYGIDVAAHRAALEAGLPTAAVMAHGLDTVYPADHRDMARRIVESGTGALVTEYLSGTRAHRGNFLARNRIVAALGAAVVVVESAHHGGALYTAGLAAQYGRSVFAVPGRWCDKASEGCNNLIAAGQAQLLTSAEQFVELMHWETAAEAPAGAPALDFTALTGTSRLIADHLRVHPNHSVSDIVASLGLPASEVSARLMEMEMNDLLTMLPGGRFQLNF